MYALARPMLFVFSAHAAHALAMLSLAPLEASKILRAIVRPRLEPALGTSILGLKFPSIVGLAGGFDKNALRPRALAALGFGFLELGTVTAVSQTENPRPNLFRLPRDRALVNRLGFPNDGARTIAARAQKKRADIGVPIAISIGKSRAVSIDDAIEDYLASLRAVQTSCDFVIVNISSPNTKDLRAMQQKERAGDLLKALKNGAKTPLFVKVAPDLDDAALEALFAVIEENDLAGVVATNTTLVADGGLSGPPLRARAIEVVRRARDRLKTRTIIGVGGIETGEDLIAFLRAGADLAQIYTSFVYRGPRAPVLIAREALAIARREGAASLAEMVRR